MRPARPSRTLRAEGVSNEREEEIEEVEYEHHSTAWKRDKEDWSLNDGMQMKAEEHQEK